MPPGAAVSVRLPKELPALSPGFLHRGERGCRRPRGGREPSCACTGTSRAAGAPALVAALTARLNACARAVPSRRSPTIRSASTAATPRCCTSAAGRFAARSARAARTLPTRCASHLRRRSRPSRSRSPPASALAEDRATGESFGERRCALLAEAIVRAHEAGRAADRARSMPWSPASPRPGVRARRAVPRAVARRPPCPLTTRSSTRPRRSAVASWPMRCGTTAAAAGSAPSVDPARRGASSTARSSRTCTTGPRRRPVPRAARRRDRRRGGPSHCSSVRCVRRSRCAGAPARPARRASTPVSLGVAWAAAHVARCSTMTSCAAGAARVAAAAQPPPGSERCPDVDPGQRRRRSSRCSRWRSASTTRRCSRTRVAAGDELIDRCARHASTAGPGRIPDRRRPASALRALARRAGIGWALLELFAATGDERFRAAAERRLRLRAVVARRALRAPGPTCASAASVAARPALPSPAIGTWCHGEARHRAHTSARDRRARAEAIYRDERRSRSRPLAGICTGLSSRSATISRSATARPAPPTCCCAGGGARRAMAGRRVGAGRGGDRAPRAGPGLAVRRAGRDDPRLCSAGSAGSAGGSCGCTTRRSRRRSSCPSAVDSAARAGVGSSDRSATLATRRCSRGAGPASASSSSGASRTRTARARADRGPPARARPCRSWSRSSGTSATPVVKPANATDNWLLLYLDWRMIRWLLIEGAGIVHADTRRGGRGNPARDRDVLWVDRDAAVGCGSGSQSVEARFLTGEFTRAADFEPRDGRRATTGPSVSPRRTAFCGRSRASDRRQPAAARSCSPLVGRELPRCARERERAHVLEAPAHRALEDPHDLALAERGDLSVPTHRDVVQLALAGLQHRERRARVRVPEAQRAVLARAEHLCRRRP